MEASRRIIRVIEAIEEIDAELASSDMTLGVHQRRVRLVGAGESLVLAADAEVDECDCFMKALIGSGRPSFVEIASAGLVTRLLSPVATRVSDIAQIEPPSEEAPRQYRVRLERSALPHILRESSDVDTGTLDVLRDAMRRRKVVHVTTGRNKDVIIDAQIDEQATLDLADGSESAGIPGTLPIVPEDRVTTFFDQVFLPRTCALPNIGGDCVPFEYPDNYCWAVAHRISLMLAEAGFTPGKAWLFGHLEVATPMKRECLQAWDFHVASFVRVGPLEDDLLVIDPVVSMTGPVRIASWIEAVDGVGATKQLTDASIYLKGELDAGFLAGPDDMRFELRKLRCELRCRFEGQPLPPFTCPPHP